MSTDNECDLRLARCTQADYRLRAESERGQNFLDFTTDSLSETWREGWMLIAADRAALLACNAFRVGLSVSVRVTP